MMLGIDSKQRTKLPTVDSLNEFLPPCFKASVVAFLALNPWMRSKIEFWCLTVNVTKIGKVMKVRIRNVLKLLKLRSALSIVTSLKACSFRYQFI